MLDFNFYSHYVMKKSIYLIVVLLFFINVSLLQAKESISWKESKHEARRAVCNYEVECMDYCSHDGERSCNCFSEEEKKEISWTMFLYLMVLRLYDMYATDEGFCKYVKKCYQYGYCPICNCSYSISKEEFERLRDKEEL